MRTVVDRYEDGILGVPDDGRYIPITNSEIAKIGCMRAWWFRQVEGLRRPVMEGKALDRGSAWDLIMEDAYRWWQVHDRPYKSAFLDHCAWCSEASIAGPDHVGCDVCDDTGDGSLVRAMRPWWDALEHDPPPFEEETIHVEEERLRRAWQGYVEMYQGGPLQRYRIVGTQTKLARVVVNPRTGAPYCPDTFLIEVDPGVWVRAGTGDLALHPERIRKVNWPVYQVGALDAIASDRRNSEGWVIDAKYTASMRSFHERLQVDPQLPGYCWLLDEHKEQFGISRVAGMMYDLTSSRMHSDPFELKWKPPLVGEMRAMAEARGIPTKGVKGVDAFMALLGIEPGHGGFSTADSKLGGVPSWRMRDAVVAAGLSLDEYSDAIDWCGGHVDPELYDRPWRLFPAAELERYAAEVYGKARQNAALHRGVIRARHEWEINAAYPRTPVCAMPGGSCSYRAPCMNDTPEARAQLDQRPTVTWVDDSAAAPDDAQDEVVFSW